MSELNIPGFIAFLRGEVTIDGHWFGGDGPIRGGIRRNFWWREHLPKLSSHIERQDAEIAQLRADLSESRRLLDVSQECVLALRKELIAFQKDVEGAEQKDLSFAMACVRDVEGITVRGALEMQREEIALLRKELADARRLLDEARAQTPAICFPRQPNGDGGWVIDANYVAAIRKDCFPIEWQPCEEEVEAVLLAVERAAPVPAQPALTTVEFDSAYNLGWHECEEKMAYESTQPAAVPEAGAKDVSALDAAGQFNRKVAYAWFPLRISRKRQLISDCGITMPQALTESDSQWAMRALLAMLERAECRSAILSAADAEVKNG